MSEFSFNWFWGPFMQILIQSVHQLEEQQNTEKRGSFQLSIELQMGKDREEINREIHDLKALTRNIRYIIEDLGEENPFEGEFGRKKLESLKTTLIRLLPYVQEMMLLAETAKSEQGEDQ